MKNLVVARGEDLAGDVARNTDTFTESSSSGRQDGLSDLPRRLRLKGMQGSMPLAARAWRNQVLS